jgi:hypothetical protein
MFKKVSSLNQQVQYSNTYGYLGSLGIVVMATAVEKIMA